MFEIANLPLFVVTIYGLIASTTASSPFDMLPNLKLEENGIVDCNANCTSQKTLFLYYQRLVRKLLSFVPEDTDASSDWINTRISLSMRRDDFRQLKAYLETDLEENSMGTLLNQDVVSITEQIDDLLIKSLYMTNMESLRENVRHFLHDHLRLILLTALVLSVSWFTFKVRHIRVQWLTLVLFVSLLDSIWLLYIKYHDKQAEKIEKFAKYEECVKKKNGYWPQSNDCKSLEKEAFRNIWFDFSITDLFMERFQKIILELFSILGSSCTTFYTAYSKNMGVFDRYLFSPVAWFVFMFVILVTVFCLLICFGLAENFSAFGLNINRTKKNRYYEANHLPPSSQLLKITKSSRKPIMKYNQKYSIKSLTKRKQNQLSN